MSVNLKLEVQAVLFCENQKLYYKNLFLCQYIVFYSAMRESTVMDPTDKSGDRHLRFSNLRLVKSSTNSLQQ